MASSGGESSMSGDESEGKGKMSEYEKQRFARIAENKARLEALGISKAAKALLDPSLNSRKRRGKRNSGEEDDDYRPEEADGDEEDDEYEDFVGDSTSKKRKKTSASKRTLLSKKNMNTSDSLGEDDDGDFEKAIALSLQGSRNTPTKKVRKELMSKTQMTQDELLIYFYQFDEAGKGFIALRDVAKMATVHDFTWTQEELQDMIRCFDMDKDGKLSLEEFRKIVTRCRMLKQS